MIAILFLSLLTAPTVDLLKMDMSTNPYLFPYLLVFIPHACPILTVLTDEQDNPFYWVTWELNFCWVMLMMGNHHFCNDLLSFYNDISWGDFSSHLFLFVLRIIFLLHFTTWCFFSRNYNFSPSLHPLLRNYPIPSASNCHGISSRVYCTCIFCSTTPVYLSCFLLWFIMTKFEEVFLIKCLTSFLNFLLWPLFQTLSETTHVF